MRLIDADKLRKDVLDLPDCYNGFSDTYDKARILDLVDEQPTVKPKQGKWINDKGIYKCTVCNDLCLVAGWASCISEEQMYKVFKFCPNCGSKMEETK